MARQWWNEPITIESRDIGRYVTIDSTERAAHYILQEWPREESGEVFEAAKRALLDALEAKGSIDYARSAFIAAAEEAQISFFNDEAASSPNNEKPAAANVRGRRDGPSCSICQAASRREPTAYIQQN